MAAAMPTLEEKVALNKAIIDSFNDDPGDPKVTECVADHYYQHNLLVPDTKAGYAGAIGAIAKQAKDAGFPLMSKVHRAMIDPSDEGYTFFHVEYNFFGPKAGFDVCRWEDGKIVEHWDNLSSIPEGESANGHTMFDGPTEATDLDKTDENKKLVKKFTFEVLCCGMLDKIPTYVAENYIQHDPAIKDGIEAFTAQCKAMEESGSHMLQSRHICVGQGNFVLMGGERNSTYIWDLYRVEGGKLAEHWGTIEPETPAEKLGHKNGKW